jgi:hypothetical protein
MTTTLVRHCLGLASLFLALASCGPLPQAGGGIGGTGSVATVSSGPVTKFGSVFVSGTEYDNSRTIYCIDDEPCSSVNRLKLGMVVLVNGSTTEHYANHQPLARVADTIIFEETVEGVVESIASDGLSMVVLGQVIHLDQKTIIDAGIPGQSIANLVVGQDRIEVSGFVVGDGHILATLIMMHTGTPHFEVQGSVKNHDVLARTFEIGALRIAYSTADISQLSTQPSPWNGLVVHVRGDQWSHSGGGPSGGTLTATRVTALGLGVDDSEEAEVEGFVLRINGPGDFVVNNLRIQTASSTVFEGGTAGDLTIDAHVIVHGRLSGGILQAEHISFEGELELESTVVGIDGAARSLTLAGFPGITVLIDDHTAIDGEGDLRTFEGITVLDHLKIHARGGSAGLLATELERSEPNTGVKLQGPVRSVSNQTLVIAGAPIDTAGIPDNRFIGDDGTVIGRSSFFQNLTVGDKVSLRGTAVGNGVAWTSARLRVRNSD